MPPWGMSCSSILENIEPSSLPSEIDIFQTCHLDGTCRVDLGRRVSSKSMLASYSGLRFTYSIVPFLSSFHFVACRRSVGQPMLERVRVMGTTTTVRLPERSPGLVFRPARPSRAFTLFSSFATTRPFQVSFVCVFSFEPFRCTGIVSRGLHVFQDIYNHVLSYL
jgi:hypothetical protein